MYYQQIKVDLEENRSSLGFVKVRKGQKDTLNKEIFLARFNLSSVIEGSKTYIKQLEHNPYIIKTPYTDYSLNNQDKAYTFENWAVEQVSCVGSNFSPECLYNFTASIELADQVVYRC